MPASSYRTYRNHSQQLPLEAWNSEDICAFFTTTLRLPRSAKSDVHTMIQRQNLTAKTLAYMTQEDFIRLGMNARWAYTVGNQLETLRQQSNTPPSLGQILEESNSASGSSESCYVSFESQIESISSRSSRSSSCSSSLAISTSSSDSLSWVLPAAFGKQTRNNFYQHQNSSSLNSFNRQRQPSRHASILRSSRPNTAPSGDKKVRFDEESISKSTSFSLRRQKSDEFHLVNCAECARVWRLQQQPPQPLSSGGKLRCLKIGILKRLKAILRR